MYEESIIKGKENYIRVLEQEVRELNRKINEECDTIAKMKLANANEKYGLKEGDKIAIIQDIPKWQGLDQEVTTFEHAEEVYFKDFSSSPYNYTSIVLSYYKPKKDGSKGKRVQWVYLFEIKDIKKL